MGFAPKRDAVSVFFVLFFVLSRPDGTSVSPPDDSRKVSTSGRLFFLKRLLDLKRNAAATATATANSIAGFVSWLM